MEIVNLTNNQLKQLQPLSLNSHIINSEANFYQINPFNNNPELIKMFYVNDSKIFESKLKVIQELINKAAYLPPELVLPKRLFAVNKSVFGYIMEYILNNQNLSEILNSNIPLFQKNFIFKTSS